MKPESRQRRQETARGRQRALGLPVRTRRQGAQCATLDSFPAHGQFSPFPRVEVSHGFFVLFSFDFLSVLTPEAGTRHAVQASLSLPARFLSLFFSPQYRRRRVSGPRAATRGRTLGVFRGRCAREEEKTQRCPCAGIAWLF